ncbi:DUF3850 domain-containing protein [Pseudomonas sp. NPDC079086]|uniref:DUF3850 domain-containing protein n=1 Tax=unclassified Pseudomonas TaxID=196821 RepID=UPI0037C770C0
MAHHELKIHEQPFNDLLSGAKTCEVRNNDRGFQAGDTVQLHEIADDFTGRVMARKITHVQTGYGLPDGLCVLSYAQVPSQGGEAVAWMLADAVGGSMLEFQRDLLLENQCRYGGEIVPLYTHPADQVAGPANQIAWKRRDGVMGCKRFMTQKVYDAQSPQMKGNYEPFYCAHCVAGQLAEPDAVPVELLRRISDPFTSTAYLLEGLKELRALLAAASPQ